VRPLKKIIAPPGSALRTELNQRDAKARQADRRKDPEMNRKPEKGVGPANGPTTHDVEGQGVTQEDVHGKTAPAGPSNQVIEDAKQLDRPSSQASRRSTDSARSHKSGKSSKKIAAPFPTFDPPAAALKGGGDESDDEEYEEHAFDHPSTYEEQTWIWLPKDEFGFSELFVEEFKKAGVDASDIGSTMDANGTVEVGNLAFNDQ
jgi:hypothetical protein